MCSEREQDREDGCVKEEGGQLLHLHCYSGYFYNQLLKNSYLWKHGDMIWTSINVGAGEKRKKAP